MQLSFGWRLFFATLFMSLTVLTLHVWVQEQQKERQALLAGSKPTSRHTVRTFPSATNPPDSHFVSGDSEITAAEVKTVPYSRGGRSPFQLPNSQATVYRKAPLADPVNTVDTVEQSLAPPPALADDRAPAYHDSRSPFIEKEVVRESHADLSPFTPVAPQQMPLAPHPQAEMLDDNPWLAESDPDLGAEPNSPRNNLEKFAELMPPPQAQPEMLPAIDQDPSFEHEPSQPITQFASSPKVIPSEPLGSAVRSLRRGPSQPIIEIEIPEWDPYAAWPKPTTIVNQLEDLREHQATRQWAAETYQLLKLLHWTKSIDDPNATVIFQQLASKLDELDNICIEISNSPVYSAEYAQGNLAGRLLVFRYDIARRIAMWSHMHQIAVQNDSYVVNEIEDRNPMAQVAQHRFVAPQLGSEWDGYLALDELSQSLNSLNPDPKSQRAAARTTLARYFSSAIQNEHRQFLDPYFDDQLVHYLREKAIGPVDMRTMIKTIEQHEANPSGYTLSKMNDLYQNMLWSTEAGSQQLATQLEGHYRNANFRVSVSDAFVNRLIPQQPDTNQSIHETVLGANIRGNGRISNRLRIRLLPDNGRINLRLESNGMVRSMTQARRSGFTIDNQGHTRFQAFKNMAIGRNGVQSEVAQAYSQTNSKVLRMRSELDPIPLVGWVARRVAKDKIAKSTPVVERITNRKVEQSARQEIETQVQQQLRTVQNYLTDNLMQPLIAMEMEPTPLEMKTTSDRIIMRYRLAGRDQMAAHTARPRALADSMMSLQFHESMFNNLLDRIDLNGNEFTAEELVQHLRNVFRSDQAGSREIDAEATFVFAPYDPLRIRFVDNKIELSLNLKKFRIGKGKTWKNLNVTATYLPTATGMRLALVQDDSGISLKGSNLKIRDQFAVRTVFTALFEDRYEMNILPKKFGEQFQAHNLRISQLAITDGWIGISLGEQFPAAATYQADQRHAQPASQVPVYNFSR